MGSTIRFLRALTLLVLISAPPLHAQGGRSSDNILWPQPPLPFYVGVEAGRGEWSNEASFSVSDGGMRCASFAEGDGSGPTYGARAFWYLNQWLMFAPRARYESRSGIFMTDLPGEPARNAADSIVMLQQTGRVKATMATATLDLQLGIDIASTGLYLSAGPSASLLYDGFYDYFERINGPVEYRYVDSRSDEHQLVAGRPFERYRRLAFDLRGSLGFLWTFGRLAINPELFYSYPLTSAFSEPDLLKQSGVVGVIGLLYNVGE